MKCNRDRLGGGYSSGNRRPWQRELTLEILEDRLALSAVSPAPVPAPAPSEPSQVQSLQRSGLAPILVTEFSHLGPVTAAPPLATSVRTPSASLDRPLARPATPPVLPAAERPFGIPYIHGATPPVTDVMVSNISGVVFEDLNDDGVRQPGERALAGQTVLLEAQIEGEWTQLISTTSDDNGRYIFSGLAPGKYRIKVLDPQTPTKTKVAGPTITLTGEADQNEINLGVNPRQPVKPPPPERAPEEKNREDADKAVPGSGDVFFRLLDRLFEGQATESAEAAHTQSDQAFDLDAMIWSCASASPVAEAATAEIVS